MYLLLALNMDCFFELPTAAGWITAPDNDDDGFYDFNLNCVYVVQGMDDELIEFQVQYVDLEASSGCKYDNLSVSIDFVTNLLQYTALCTVVYADNLALICLPHKLLCNHSVVCGI